MRAALPGCFLLTGGVFAAAASLGGVAAAEEAPEETAAPGRPAPLVEPLSSPRVPSERHVDVGASFVFISPFAKNVDETPTKVHYQPGPGASAFTRIVIHRYLHAAAVFSWGIHGIDADNDALGVRGPLDTPPMTSYRLEAHVLPTLPIGDRIRLFGVVGIGWGRLEFGRMYAQDDGGPFLIRSRGATYFDVPLGIGTSVELVPRWMSFDIAVWSAPTFAREGLAHSEIISIGSNGTANEVGGLPQVPVWFVQSFGLSLLL